jgi:hypothetical protein
VLVALFLQRRGQRGPADSSDPTPIVR